MNEFPYCWEDSFRALVSETDPLKFDDKVREVEEALWSRSQELSIENEHVADERTAIEDASATILKLKNKRVLPNPS
jgi:hypothetical protein